MYGDEYYAEDEEYGGGGGGQRRTRFDDQDGGRPRRKCVNLFACEFGNQWRPYPHF